MVKKENQRPVGDFSKAVSLEVKGLMARHGITQTTFANALGRNQGYVSERANGIKAFDTDELDIFAGLIGITGQDLLTTVSRRIAEDRAPSNVTVGRFGQTADISDLDRAATSVDETARGEAINDRDWYNRTWVAIRKGTAAASMSVHDLRHVAATLSIAAGADVKLVQEMLGHKDATETLNTYSHLWPSKLGEVISLVEERRRKALVKAA